MGLKEILAAKQEAAMKLAAEGAGIDPATVHVKGTSAVITPASINQATGMAGSFGPAAILHQAPKIVKGKIDPALAEAALAVYEDNDWRPLKKVIRGPGGKTLAVNGFFYAKDEEDVRILDQYAKRGSVKLVPKKEAE